MHLLSSRMALSVLLVAVAAPLSAQQSYSPYPTPLPPPTAVQPPAAAPGVSGWPSEEVLPGLPFPGEVEELIPGELVPGQPQGFPISGEDSLVAQATSGWLQPSLWGLPGKISGGVELGINGSDGNAEAFSFKTGFDLSHKTDNDELKFDLEYTKATADGVETQHNALFNASYERQIADSKWNTFLKEALEYDEFKAFNLRIALNGGLGYQVIKTETISWKTRFGAGASTEVGGPTDDWVPEGVFGTDFEKQLSDRQKFSLTSDYFPDWTDFTNYRVVTKASYVITLNEEYNLNLKMSINDRYDSTPNGRKPNDINYSILLLWKM